MDKLEDISDEVISYCELKEDIVFKYIPVAERKSYIEKSIEIAMSALRTYQGKPLRQILEDNGVAVIMHDDCESDFIHSQIYYDDKVKKIDIYLKSLEKMQEAMKWIQYDISMEELVNIHLAHEFYHFHEFFSESRTDEKVKPVRYRILGIINRTSNVHRTCEIAAHIFAKFYCGLQIHPKIMDYVLMEYQSGGCKENIVRNMELMELELTKEADDE